MSQVMVAFNMPIVIAALIMPLVMFFFNMPLVTSAFIMSLVMDAKFNHSVQFSKSESSRNVRNDPVGIP